MTPDDIIIHRLYRALVYAESRLRAKGLWSEVDDQTIGQPLAEYRACHDAKGFKEALRQTTSGQEALDETIDDRDTDTGC